MDRRSIIADNCDLQDLRPGALPEGFTWQILDNLTPPANQPKSSDPPSNEQIAQSS
jgi:hypothetical protein